MIALEEEDWKDEAACLGADHKVFFGPDEEEFIKGSHYRGPQGRLEALEYCASCGVQVECFDYAIRNKERWGVWGGVNFSSKRVREAKGDKLLITSLKCDRR